MRKYKNKILQKENWISPLNLLYFGRWPCQQTFSYGPSC